MQIPIILNYKLDSNEINQILTYIYITLKSNNFL